MNANELADYLDNSVEAMIMSEQPYIDQAAAMLRQQQAEIEMLKKLLDDFGITVNKKAAKYSDAWWKEVEEFNKQLGAQEK
jgi:hypothetical protein